MPAAVGPACYNPGQIPWRWTVKRFACPCFVFLCCLSFLPAAFAQTKQTVAKKDATPAALSAPAPVSEEVMKARMRAPTHGTAYIEIIKGESKKVGNDIVTTTKVKNVSDAPIVGLRLDEWWYAKGQQVSGDTAKLRFPLAAGEITEMTTHSPIRGDMNGGSQLQFTHANGGVKVTSVKKFADAKKK
jgi:hypothetical protein